MWCLKRILFVSGLLLYGAGKSISAEAIANALGKNIIMADYSELIDSKWGNTEKFLTALFKQAEESGSVIFIDEADGLLGKRANTDSNSATMNDVKSHLLKLVDRSNVIVIYATNLFENFDRACNWSDFGIDAAEVYLDRRAG